MLRDRPEKPSEGLQTGIGGLKVKLSFTQERSK